MRPAAFTAMAVCLALAGAAAASELSGRVVEDSTDAPLAAVQVRVTVSGHAGLDLSTDADGRFRAPGLSPGECRIELGKTGFLPAVAIVAISADAPAPAARTLRLLRGGAIEGRVVDSSGAPVRGAMAVALRAADDGSLSRPAADCPGCLVSLGSSGSYRLHGLMPGRYAVAFVFGAADPPPLGMAPAPSIGLGAALYPSDSSPRVFAISGGEELTGVDFSLADEPLSRVTGTVEGGPPQSRYSVTLLAASLPAHAIARAATDEDGRFHFAGVRPGTYRLLAAGPSEVWLGRDAVLGNAPLYGRATVTVSGHDLEDVSVPVRSGAALALSVRFEPAPTSGAACPGPFEARLSPLEDWAANLERTVSQAVGAPLAVTGLAPTRYLLAARDPSGVCHQAGQAAVDISGAGEHASLAVSIAPGGAIRGKLAGTAKPQDYLVLLISDERMLAAVPDAAGAFLFTPLRPGRYRIAARAATAGTRWISGAATPFDLDVVSGATTEVDLPAPAPPAR